MNIVAGPSPAPAGPAAGLCSVAVRNERSRGLGAAPRAQLLLPPLLLTERRWRCSVPPRRPNNDRVCVIDVRDADFAGGHIRGAVNVGEQLPGPGRSCVPAHRPAVGVMPAGGRLSRHLPATPTPCAVAETFEDNVLVDRVVSRFCR